MKLCYFATDRRARFPGALFAEKADRKNAWHEPRLLHELGERSEREGVQTGAPDRAQEIRWQENQDPVSRPRLSRLDPGRPCRRAVRTSAPRNTAPSRLTLSAFPTAWNTASTNWASSTCRAANSASQRQTQIEEVILREGPETVGALCLEPDHRRRRRHRSARRLLGARAARSATTVRQFCCTSTKWSVALAAPAPNGSAISTMASSLIS